MASGARCALNPRWSSSPVPRQFTTVDRKVSMTARNKATLLFFAAMLSADAQWLNYPTPGTPRTKDGKPNLSAKTPRLAGKPDLSGVWQVEPEVKGEIERMLGKDAITVDVVPGDDITTFSRYFYNILADFKPEEAPLRPEATAIMRNRPKDTESPSIRCLPSGVARGTDRISVQDRANRRTDCNDVRE